MLFNVFNKRPSANAIKEAMSTSDIQEQMECLAYATAPTKGELWKSPCGRVVVVCSDPLMMNAKAETFADVYGVIIADVENGEITDTEIFNLTRLLPYEKIGKMPNKNLPKL